MWRISSGSGRNAIQQKQRKLLSESCIWGAKSCQLGMEGVSGVCRLCLCSLWRWERLPLRRDLTSDITLMPWEGREITQRQVRRISAHVCVCALFPSLHCLSLFKYFLCVNIHGIFLPQVVTVTDGELVCAVLDFTLWAALQRHNHAAATAEWTVSSSEPEWLWIFGSMEPNQKPRPRMSSFLSSSPNDSRQPFGRRFRSFQPPKWNIFHIIQNKIKFWIDKEGDKYG